VENEYISAERDDRSLTVSLKGDWVLGNVSDLEAALADVDAGGAAAVTFQCGGRQEQSKSRARYQNLRARSYAGLFLCSALRHSMSALSPKAVIGLIRC
jgi:hypothetical protein